VTENPPVMGALTIESLEDARYWIGVQHRQLCSDISMIVDLQARVRRLERPWWKRWLDV
jgi:hypothetical protein